MIKDIFHKCLMVTIARVRSRDITAHAAEYELSRDHQRRNYEFTIMALRN